MINGDEVNKNFWSNVEPENILAGLSFPGVELLGRLKAGDKILDLGCGTGKVSEYLAEKGYLVTGVDLNEKALKEAQERNSKITYLVADATEGLPFENEVFEAVVVSFVFVSIINKEKQRIVAEEIKRVLKPGGYLWLCEGTYSPDYLERYKKGKEMLGEDNVAFSLDPEGQIKRVIRHYKEEDFDSLFVGLFKIESTKTVVKSPSSGMNVESLRMIYKK